MTALAGCWHRDDGRHGADTLDRMLERLGPRCRDFPMERAHVESPNHGVLDAAGSRCIAEGHRVIVGDVRLDNRDEIADRVGIEADDDLRLILAAHDKWSTATPRYLCGAFAYVLWDRDRGRGFAARDHVGLRPLYTHHRAGCFAFASEIKALLTDPNVPTTLDELRIADYLAVRFDDRSRTFYRDVKRVPAGHVLTFGDDAPPHLARYWNPRDASAIDGDDEELAQRFRELLLEAVDCRLPTNGPVGFFVSGGLDSAAVVGAAIEAGAGRLAARHAFNATFPDYPRIDERGAVTRLLEHGPIANVAFCRHEVRVDQIGALDDGDRVAATQDEPFHAPNLFIHQALTAAAAESSLVSATAPAIILDGIDGDTTVGHGLEWLQELCAAGHVVRAWREARRLGRRLGQSGRRLLAQFGLRPMLQATIARTFPTRPPAFLSPEWLRRIDWSRHCRETGYADPGLTVHEQHARQLESGILTYYLEVNDRASAACGIEHRHPFYDRRLMEFCAAVPPDQKLADGWDRVIQRRAVAGWVPEATRWRIDKSYWAANFERALAIGARNRIESTVRDPERIGGFIEPSALRKSWDLLDSRRHRDADMMLVWLAVTLDQWLRSRETSPGVRLPQIAAGCDK